MASLKQFAQRQVPPWGFPFIYLGWAWFFWILIVLSGQNVWTFPNIILLLIGGLSPVLAGLGLMGLTQGRVGFYDLWRRLKDISLISSRWWVIIILFYPTFNLFIAFLAILTGISSNPLAFITLDRLLIPSSLLILIAVALIFPFIEEIGLRGYWLDRLQRRYNTLSASLFLGVVWAVWHIPLIFMEGYYSEVTFNPEIVPFLISIILGSIIVTWVYNNTQRSVLAIILFHFMGNLTGEVMGLASELFIYSILMKGIIAIFIIAWAGPKRLRKQN